ncbi:alpha/beta hydrolase [Lentibacter sp.]|uniref:alpha/beta hydrolase n=1 Tax=Lentibacter sp. TaxID=2024994 RepID=UPI003F6A03B5
MGLDDAYANTAYIPDGESFPPKWAAAAAEFRDKVEGAELDLAYGPEPRQRLDLFRPQGEAQGLLIFVHGGFWRMLDKSYWSHLAAGALARGWAVAMPSYTLCPETSIAGITREIAKAVSLAAEAVAGPIALTGHSAGGHLVARMLARGMLPETIAARLSHVMPISPLSDLRPLMQTSMNADFKLDEAAAVAESPIFMEDRVDCPVTVWVGGAERPAFLDQAGWLSDAWGCDLVEAAGKHHFDVVDGLADAESEMLARLLG